MITLNKTQEAAEHKNKILVVDDDPVIRKLIGTILAAIGYDFDIAVDGQAAVVKLENSSFTTVIADISMPHMDGMELLKYIRSNYPWIDVIVVTGYTNIYTYTDVIKAGASDFLTKPFSKDELEAKLNRIIREQKLIRKLEYLSKCDVLTGLLNRRCFNAKIEEEIPRAHRQGYPVFLAMVDVDKFKEYNDHFGHQAGDELLQALAKILEQSTRENVDWCFRYGGDEFTIILPYTTIEQVLLIAERILHKYRKHELADTSLSIGMARFVRHPSQSWAEDINGLITRADQTMYQSKKENGDKVVCDFSSQKRENRGQKGGVS